jgi:kynurenine formamidase
MSLHLGQQFPTFAAFKQAMQNWVVHGESKFTYHVKKSDRTCCNIVCTHSDCPFHVYAGYSSVLDCVVISSIEAEHTCVGAGPVVRQQSSQQSWLQRILPETITITKNTMPRDIIDAVTLRHHVTINYEAAKKAKSYALGDDIHQQALQFASLPAYVDAIHAANPNAHTILSTDPVTR